MISDLDPNPSTPKPPEAAPSCRRHYSIAGLTPSLKKDHLEYRKEFLGLFNIADGHRCSKENPTVDNCVTFLSALLHWQMNPGRKPGAFGYLHPTHGLFLNAGHVVGRMRNGKWEPLMQEKTEQRTLRIVIEMGLVQRTELGGMRKRKKGGKGWRANMRYLKLHPRIDLIMRGEELAPVSFDEARDRIRRGTQKAREDGVRQRGKSVRVREQVRESRFAFRLPVSSVPQDTLSPRIEEYTSYGGSGCTSSEEVITPPAPGNPVPFRKSVPGAGGGAFSFKGTSTAENAESGVPVKNDITAKSITAFSEPSTPLGHLHKHHPSRNAKISPALSASALRFMKWANDSNEIARREYAFLSQAVKNKIGEIDNRAIATYPPEPRKTRKPDIDPHNRPIPVGCEDLMTKDLNYGCPMDGSAVRNSHTWQFMQGGFTVLNWIRTTFPEIKTITAREAKAFVSCVLDKKYGFNFLRLMDALFVDPETGVARPGITGIECLTGKMREAYRDFTKQRGTTTYRYYVNHWKESGESWNSRKAPDAADIKHARNAYGLALKRWCSLGREEVLAELQTTNK